MAPVEKQNDATPGTTPTEEKESKKSKKKVTALIIIRHAERIDDHRIPGGFVTNSKNPGAYDWRYDTEPGRARPWDPPLSHGGVQQSEAFGKYLPHLIEEFKLPPLGAVYASPVVRCAETALVALKAHDDEIVQMKERAEQAEKEKAKQEARAQRRANRNIKKSISFNSLSSAWGGDASTVSSKGSKRSNQVPESQGRSRNRLKAVSSSAAGINWGSGGGSRGSRFRSVSSSAAGINWGENTPPRQICLDRTRTNSSSSAVGLSWAAPTMLPEFPGMAAKSPDAKLPELLGISTSMRSPESRKARRERHATKKQVSWAKLRTQTTAGHTIKEEEEDQVSPRMGAISRNIYANAPSIRTGTTRTPSMNGFKNAAIDMFGSADGLNKLSDTIEPNNATNTVVSAGEIRAASSIDADDNDASACNDTSAKAATDAVKDTPGTKKNANTDTMSVASTVDVSTCKSIGMDESTESNMDTEADVNRSTDANAKANADAVSVVSSIADISNCDSISMDASIEEPTADTADASTVASVATSAVSAVVHISTSNDTDAAGSIEVTAKEKDQVEEKEEEEKSNPGPVTVRLEQGLIECIHKQWYDQWCLKAGVVPEQTTGIENDVPNTSSNKDASNKKEMVHDMARLPITACLPDPGDMMNLLKGVTRSYVCEQERSADGGALTLAPDINCDQRILSQDVLHRLDTTENISPFESFPEEYTYDTLFEGGKAALDRQHDAVLAIAAQNAGKTVVCVTHFIPCAHLCGRLTNKDGVTEHGRAEYTSFSLYVHSDGREGEKHKDWRPLIINDQRHLKLPQQKGGRPPKKSYNLRSKLYGF